MTTYIPCPGACGSRVRPATSNPDVAFCCVPCWDTYAASMGLNRMEVKDYGHSDQCVDRQKARSAPTEDR